MKNKFGLICGVFYLVPSFISPVLAADQTPISAPDQVTAPISLDQLRSLPVKIALEACTDWRRAEVVLPDQISSSLFPGAAANLPGISTFLTTLLPPVFEAGFDTVGSALVNLSGKNTQYQRMSGVTNESFYMKSGKGYLQGICFINLRIDGNAFAVKRHGQKIWENKNLFQARLAIVPSPDNQAYYVKPLWVRYPKFILNPRSEGVAIELQFLGAVTAAKASAFSHTHLLPVGKEICGKPGSRLLAGIDGKKVDFKDDRTIYCSSNMSSVWHVFPPVSSVDTASVEGKAAVPVAIRATIWEIAGFDPFLNALGSIIQTNKSKMTTTILNPSSTP